MTEQRKEKPGRAMIAAAASPNPDYRTLNGLASRIEEVIARHADSLRGALIAPFEPGAGPDAPQYSAHVYLLPKRALQDDDSAVRRTRRELHDLLYTDDHPLLSAPLAVSVHRKVTLPDTLPPRSLAPGEREKAMAFIALGHDLSQEEIGGRRLARSV